MTRLGRRVVSGTVNLYERVFNWMENKWAATHPSTYRVYRLFKGGLKLSFEDFRQFGSARARLLGGEHLHSLSIAELDALRRVPRDIVKLTPVILVAVLPGSFLFLPVFYMFPRHLLTTRFWTEEQWRTFEADDLKRRVAAFPKVNRRLLKATDVEVLRRMVKELNKGRSCRADDVLHLSSIFHWKPLHFPKLSILHVEALCKCHVCRQIPFFQRSRLKTVARLLHNEDLAIMREGISSLSVGQKQGLCLLRGLSPFDLTEKQLDEFLERWCSVSAQLNTEEDMSLILHLPVLLSQHWRPSEPSSKPGKAHSGG